MDVWKNRLNYRQEQFSRAVIQRPPCIEGVLQCKGDRRKHALVFLSDVLREHSRSGLGLTLLTRVTAMLRGISICVKNLSAAHEASLTSPHTTARYMCTYASHKLQMLACHSAGSSVEHLVHQTHSPARSAHLCTALAGCTGAILSSEGGHACAESLMELSMVPFGFHTTGKTPKVWQSVHLLSTCYAGLKRGFVQVYPFA